MKKILCLLLVFLLCNFGFSVSAAGVAGDCSSEGDFTYLILGLDDAGENTDVMILVKYIAGCNTATVIQIPRDTYIDVGTFQNKINQIYASKKSSGATNKEAMSSLLSILSAAFDLKIDGYIAYTTKAFVSFVDALSGIDVYMPFDVTISDGDSEIMYRKGQMHLSGNEAIGIVRYRKGYAMGDLARIDVQKILVSSIINKVKGSANIVKLLMLVLNNKNEMLTSLKASDIINIALKNRGKIKKMNFEYLTLPGSSVKSKTGLWYFSVNRYATQSFYDDKKFDAEFDKNNIFCNFDSVEFKDIYFSKKITPRIYDDESLKKITVRHNAG